MQLINPVGLALLLALVPIVLLYLLKLRRKERVVSSVLLWERMIRDVQANAPLQRLRFNVLLVLQALVVAGAALALARPYVQEQRLSGQSLVVILDASLSMQARDVRPSRFEAARREALRLVNRLARGSEMMVVEAGPQVRLRCGFTANKGVLRRAIASCRPSDGSCDLREAVVLALSLAEKKRATQFVVLSDGAFSPIEDLRLPRDFSVSFVKFGRRGNNVAITGLDVRRAVGGGAEVFVALDNFSPAAVSCALEIYENENLVKAKRISLAPRARKAFTLALPAFPTGVVRARIDARDDLARDNEALAVVRPPAGLRVLLVSEGNFFLERALAVVPDVQLSRVAPESYSAREGERFDVVVFDGWCPERLGRGRFLLFGCCPADGPADIIGVEEQPQILDWEREGRLLRYVYLGFPQVLVARAQVGRPRAWARTLAETARGAVIALGQRREQRALWVGFRVLDSNLPLRASFPIMVANFVSWLAEGAGPAAAQRTPVGQPLRIALPPEVKEVCISGPNEQVWRIAVRERPLLFGETLRQGIYRVRAPGVDELYAVGIVEREECDIAPRSEIRLGTGARAVRAGPLRANRELWRWFVGLALALLVVEWWVYHQRP